MPDIIKLGKTMKRHIEGINNKIRTAFKRSYGFKVQEYRDTIIYLVAGGLKLPAMN